MILRDRTVVFRTDASNAIGFGHLQRCRAIAAFVAEQGGTSAFVLGLCDDTVAANLTAANENVHILEKAGHFDAQALYSAVPDAHLVICDISHPETSPRLAALPGYLADLKAGGSSTVLIDGPLEMCLSARVSLPTDVLVIPYFGSEAETIQPGPRKIAAGLPYAIIAETYAGNGAMGRTIAEQARRILITAGGSDPTGATALCLRALANITETELDLRVAIGPAFSESARAAIDDLAAVSPHRVTLLQAPAGLAEHMLWCDLALSASGVTKYELACTGTPTLLFSTDRDLDAMNRSFETLGTCIDLGLVEHLTPTAITLRLRDVLSDPDKRRALSDAGRRAVDGQGCARMFEALSETTSKTLTTPS